MSPPMVLPVLHLIPESEKLAEMGIRLAITAVVALALTQLTSLLIGRLELWMIRAGQQRPGGEQRAKTLAQILRNLAATVIWGGACIHGLAILGWDVRPLLAGAGILGVALGFGAQTLVRDLIAGIFVLVENQYAVGDVIDIGGQPAQVEEVTLRHTRLRNFNGHVHYVPNGELKTVTNRSRGWNRLAVDFALSASEDLPRALALCRDVIARLNAEPAWQERLLEPAELWGVESVAGSEVQIRMVVRCRPGPDAFRVARELRLRCHEALAQAKIRAGTAREIAIAPAPGGVGLSLDDGTTQETP